MQRPQERNAWESQSDYEQTVTSVSAETERRVLSTYERKAFFSLPMKIFLSVACAVALFILYDRNKKTVDKLFSYDITAAPPRHPPKDDEAETKTATTASAADHKEPADGKDDGSRATRTPAITQIPAVGELAKSGNVSVQVKALISQTVPGQTASRMAMLAAIGNCGDEQIPFPNVTPTLQDAEGRVYAAEKKLAPKTPPPLNPLIAVDEIWLFTVADPDAIISAHFKTESGIAMVSLEEHASGNEQMYEEAEQRTRDFLYELDAPERAKREKVDAELAKLERAYEDANGKLTASRSSLKKIDSKLRSAKSLLDRAQTELNKSKADKEAADARVKAMEDDNSALARSARARAGGYTRALDEQSRAQRHFDENTKNLQAKRKAVDDAQKAFDTENSKLKSFESGVENAKKSLDGFNPQPK